MKPFIPPLLSTALLFGSMMVLLEIGRRVGLRRWSRESEGERASLGTIEGAMFALFGFLLAFTFSGGASRFNDKRMLIAEEANTIETAYLRLQLVSSKAQSELQGLFRAYIDSRLETYRKLPDLKAASPAIARSAQLQQEIWTRCVAATELPGSHRDAGKLLLPALNNMIDITTTRSMALQTHPPAIIYGLLFSLALICSLLAGYRMSVGKNRSWLHIMSFAGMTVVVIYVLLDIEYPRAGLIRLHAFDQVLIDVRERMQGTTVKFQP